MPVGLGQVSVDESETGMGTRRLGKTERRGNYSEDLYDVTEGVGRIQGWTGYSGCRKE